MKILFTTIIAGFFLFGLSNVDVGAAAGTYIHLAENEKISHFRRIHYTRLALKTELCKSQNIERKVLFRIATNFFKLNSWEDLKQTSLLALSESKKAQMNLDIAESYRFLGTYYTYTSKNDSAYFYLLKAKKIYIKEQAVDSLPKIYTSIALVQYFDCAYFESMSNYFKVLKLVKNKNQKECEYIALSNIGIILKDIGEYTKSDEYNLQAKEIAEKEFNDKTDYVEGCLNNMGYNCFKRGEYEKSARIYIKALNSLKAKGKFNDLHACLLDNLANSYLAMNDFKKPPLLYLEAQKIRDSFNIDQGRNYNKLYLSNYYYRVGNVKKAIELNNEAMLLSQKFKAPKDVLECLKQLILCDRVNAFQNSVKYFHLSDSLQQAERRNRDKFARIAFETDQITAEKEIAIKHKKIILITAASAFLVLGLLFIIKLQRSRQRELMFTQAQQKSDAAIYQLISEQQSNINQGRQEEKKRIARELHDGVMNRLASTRLNLFILSKRRDEETIEKCLAFIDDIQDIEKEIRQVAHDLDSEIFSGNKSFNILLDGLFDEIRSVSPSKLFVEIDPEINWEGTAAALRINVYRILQEGLQNANKYAQARNVFVTIVRENGALRLIIHDDGIGFNLAKAKKGIGLKNIAYRVKSLSGDLMIKADKDKGVLISILFPL